MVFAYTMEYYSALKKWNINIFGMNGPAGYSGKWNKSERERKMLYDFIYL